MKRYIKSDKEYETGGKTFDGYMGATGWEGRNYDLHLDIKEIAKIVRSQFKKKFPGYKISARISRFSGGQSLDVVVWMHLSDLMPKDEFVAKAAANPWEIFRPNDWVSYKDENGKYTSKLAESFFYDMQRPELEEFFSDYYDDTVAEYSGGSATYPTINYSSAVYGIPLINKEPLDYVKNLMDSFNYDDSNSMVDYFSVNFYDSLEYKFD
jgi:hypothetical protein